jgi:hypothetical protein
LQCFQCFIEDNDNDNDDDDDDAIAGLKKVFIEDCTLAGTASAMPTILLTRSLNNS